MHARHICRITCVWNSEQCRDTNLIVTRALDMAMLWRVTGCGRMTCRNLQSCNMVRYVMLLIGMTYWDDIVSWYGTTCHGPVKWDVWKVLDQDRYDMLGLWQILGWDMLRPVIRLTDTSWDTVQFSFGDISISYFLSSEAQNTGHVAGMMEMSGCSKQSVDQGCPSRFGTAIAVYWLRKNLNVFVK